MKLLNSIWVPLTTAGIILVLFSQDVVGEAVVREMFEEVGLAVQAVEQVWRWTHPDGQLVLDWWTVESAGGRIGPNPAEVAEAMTWPGIIGLGEMMNFPGVVSGDEEVLKKISASKGKIIDGHVSAPPPAQQVQTAIAHDFQKPRLQRTFCLIVGRWFRQYRRERLLYRISSVILVTENLNSQCMRSDAELYQFLFHVVGFHVFQ